MAASAAAGHEAAADKRVCRDTHNAVRRLFPTEAGEMTAAIEHGYLFGTEWQMCTGPGVWTGLKRAEHVM